MSHLLGYTKKIEESHETLLLPSAIIITVTVIWQMSANHETWTMVIIFTHLLKTCMEKLGTYHSHFGKIDQTILCDVWSAFFDEGEICEVHTQIRNAWRVTSKMEGRNFFIMWTVWIVDINGAIKHHSVSHDWICWYLASIDIMLIITVFLKFIYFDTEFPLICCY